MKKSRKKVIILIIIPVILLLLTGGWWAFSVSVYNDNFNKRFTSYEPLMFRLEDYDGIPPLERKKYEFPSDKGQKLTGYLYSTECEQRGIIVLAHGFGAGHNSYMDCANFFAQRGYYVFAYDATGNDESEGEGVGGIPQGVADLDHAISFVEERGDPRSAGRAVRAQLGRLQRLRRAAISSGGEGGHRMRRLQPFLRSL